MIKIGSFVINEVQLFVLKILPILVNLNFNNFNSFLIIQKFI